MSKSEFYEARLKFFSEAITEDIGEQDKVDETLYRKIVLVKGKTEETITEEYLKPMGYKFSPRNSSYASIVPLESPNIYCGCLMEDKLYVWSVINELPAGLLA